jgi:hypothetical protein
VRLRIAFYIIPLLLPPAWAENWPQWRGPSGTGVSRDTGFPAEWSSTTNIAWKAPLRGLGVSSPIVWNDRVVVTYQIGANALRPGIHPTLWTLQPARISGMRRLPKSRAVGPPARHVSTHSLPRHSRYPESSSPGPWTATSGPTPRQTAASYGISIRPAARTRPLMVLPARPAVPLT